MLKLVYGCLAFSAVAGVLLIVSAANQGPAFRGPTKVMNDALAQGAKVLAADASGAVTQTGNGRVAGWTRSGEQLWSVSFDRFAEGPDNPFGAGAVDAAAWCAGGCPNALVAIRDEFTAHGGASAKLAGALTKLRLGADAILAVPGGDQAFIRAAVEGREGTQLMWLQDDGSSRLPVANPSLVQAAQRGTRILAGSVTGGGTIQRFTRSGRAWRSAGPPIFERGVQNACLSADGEWIGAISARVQMFTFGGAQVMTAGQQVAGGTCTVDRSGLTAVFNPAGAPQDVGAARFALSGRRLWVRNFGAQQLLSPAGSPRVVVRAADGTITVAGAKTGRTIATHKYAEAPYASADGSVVAADRDGSPHWLAQPGS